MIDELQEKELISIIVPVFNVEDYLCKCINSIINQTYSNIEVILVDDGSNDSSGRICDTYSSKYNNIHVIHKKNGGVTSARNEGIKFANGKYIGFVDGDDYIEKDMYDILYQEIKKDDFNVAVCNYQEIGGKSCKNSTKTDIVDEWLLNVTGDNRFKGFLWNKLYKIDIIKNSKFDCDITILEDTLYNVEIYKNNKIKYTYIEKPLYNYVIRESSALRGENPKKLSIFYAFEKMAEVLKENNLRDRAYEIEKSYILFMGCNRYKYSKTEYYSENRKNFENHINKYIRCDKLLKYIKKDRFKIIIIIFFPAIWDLMKKIQERLRELLKK